MPKAHSALRQTLNINYFLKVNVKDYNLKKKKCLWQSSV